MGNDSAPREARLRIATFNLENLDETPSTRAFLARRIAVLRPQLVALDADVLCLQEVSAHGKGHHHREMEALDHLLDGTPYARFSSTGPRGDGPADIHNLVTLSRWPFRETREIRHALVPPPAYTAITAKQLPAAIDGHFDRPLLHTIVPLPIGRALHVVNLHLRSPLAAVIPGQKQSALTWRSVEGWAEGFFAAALKRNAQALEARLVVDRIFDAEPEALIAVCGDFNAETREVPVRTIMGAVDDTGNPALATRSLAALEDGITRERRFSVRHAGAMVLLDHVLVSAGLAARNPRVEIDNKTLADEIFDAPADQPPLGSFHAPVVAEFSPLPVNPPSPPAAQNVPTNAKNARHGLGSDESE